jgi:hypothetical protein
MNGVVLVSIIIIIILVAVVVVVAGSWSAAIVLIVKEGVVVVRFEGSSGSPNAPEVVSSPRHDGWMDGWSDPKVSQSVRDKLEK